MYFTTRYAAVLACITFAGLGLSTAQANTLIVYKLGAEATGAFAFTNVVTGLTTPGSFGVNPLVTDGSSDYRDAWIDNATNWASVTNIRVGMYDDDGIEVAYLNFAGPNTAQGAGVTPGSFFSPADLVSSNYTDIPAPFTGNFFSEAGADNRTFFVNKNYGGCETDAGWTAVVVNGGYPCGWESSRTNGNGRALLYALGNVSQNWTIGNIGEANVFAITVTSDLAPGSEAPEPATLALFGAGLAAVGLTRRRRA